MIARVLDELSGRFVLVVGKGGVGKSTTSAALALGLADRGSRTHLISTDPAHSVGDLFGQDLSGAVPTTSHCAESLSLEELDAAERARSWFGEVRGAVADLMDRGTYLDGEDVELLLDRSLPGMDEVMSAIRLSELARVGEHDRVVVDTAPTGHLLRLLDCADVLEGWATALDAMSEKAGAVAAAFTRARPVFAGQQVIERLRADVARFTQDVLHAADFVLVTRSDDVVAAETVRLAEALRARGCRIAAHVSVGGGVGTGTDAPPVFDVPLRSDLSDCAGLRRWGAVGPDAATPATDRVAADAAGAAPEGLEGLELVLFAGKGGVGKSTCAAAFALATARRRSVLLLSLDPAGSLGDVLGEAVGAEGTRFGDGLLAKQLDARARLEHFRSRYRERIRAAFERVGLGGSTPLDRRVLESILEMAPPGIDEIFALDAVVEEDGGHDVLVLDMAPTGHFLRFLEMPEVALSWTRALLRILLKYRSVLGLEDFAGELLATARRLGELIEALEDPERTGVVVVTLRERLPARETGTLVRRLAATRTPVAAVIANRSDAAGHDPDGDTPDVGAPVLVAPEVRPSPVGPEALLDFHARWCAA